MLLAHLDEEDLAKRPSANIFRKIGSQKMKRVKDIRLQLMTTILVPLLK